MGSSIIFLSIGILFIFSNLIHGQEMELIAGHVLYRHGDRTPITTFPSDPVKPTDWPNGFGQLTSAGIEQQHRLGGYIRNRYASLLSTTYNPSEIVVRSTDADRTLMSVQSNLVGLYPVLNSKSDKVPIQPIPIHTVSIHEDFLLGQNDCPRYDQIEDEVDQSAEVKKANEYYDSFFKNLQLWTNMTNITVYDAWEIADTIFVEHIYNNTPGWANEAVRKNLSDVNDLAFHFLFANNDSKRIRGGPSIQDIWMNMINVVNNVSFHKVKMYSAHDTTVSAVLSFLDINYPHQPQYASALFVDLYEKNSKYFVRVEYLNVTDSNTTYEYVLNGCPNVECPFDTFTDIYRPRFPRSAALECAIIDPKTTTTMEPMPPPPGGSTGKLVTVLVIVIITLVIGILVIFLCLNLRKQDRDPPLLGIDRSLQTV